MRPPSLLATAALVSLTMTAPARAEIQVTMHDGLVSVSAKDVTIRQILAEWAKVGQTKIVNAEEIAGEPVTLQLTEMPEEKALEILLRSVSGYLAAPRPTAISNASRFDRILVMPTSAPVRSAAMPTQAQPPAFPQPRPTPFPGDQNDDEQVPRNVPPPALPLNQQRGPVFNTFPPPINPQEGPPVAPPPSASFPGQGAPAAGGSVSIPGMIAPPPQPTQPGQVPGAPPQPR